MDIKKIVAEINELTPEEKQAKLDALRTIINARLSGGQAGGEATSNDIDKLKQPRNKKNDQNNNKQNSNGSQENAKQNQSNDQFKSQQQPSEQPSRKDDKVDPNKDSHEAANEFESIAKTNTTHTLIERGGFVACLRVLLKQTRHTRLSFTNLSNFEFVASWVHI